MPRAKSSVTAHHRHKKVLELTKGHRASRRKDYRLAHDSMLHALHYAFVHRRERKGDFRRLWITRINAASRAQGLTYGEFISGLKKAGVNLDRKMLAEIAAMEPAAFASLATTVKAQAKS